MRTGILALLCFGCATTSPARPDEMSAAGHRQEAARERARADEAMARYDPAATAPLPSTFRDGPNAPMLFPLEIYRPFNPTLAYVKRSETHVQHAREHERAAAELEAFEEAECRGFPPRTRAACPVLGPDARIEDLPDGVRIHLSSEMPADATAAHMRCHLAYARARGFAPTTDCPLYVRGSDIRRAPVGEAVDIVSAISTVAKQIQRLAREQIHRDLRGER